MVAVLKPVNPPNATTSTWSRHARGRSADQVLNACLERPSTMSNDRAGPVPSRITVRPMDHRDALAAAPGASPHALVHADRGDAVEPVGVIDQHPLPLSATGHRPPPPPRPGPAPYEAGPRRRPAPARAAPSRSAGPAGVVDKAHHLGPRRRRGRDPATPCPARGPRGQIGVHRPRRGAAGREPGASAPARSRPHGKNDQATIETREATMRCAATPTCYRHGRRRPDRRPEGRIDRLPQPAQSGRRPRPRRRRLRPAGVGRTRRRVGPRAAGGRGVVRVGRLGRSGAGRVQICCKGAPRPDRPRIKARNINDSLPALRRDRGLCNRFGQPTLR